MKPRRILIKLGGSTLQEVTTLKTLSVALHQLLEQNTEVILVHGGRPAINSELTKRGITWSFENGQRVTTPEMMSVIVEVLEGQINASLTAFLQEQQLEAHSFSGRNKMLLCKQSSEKLGLVGEVHSFEAKPVLELLQNNSKALPVIAPLGCDRSGQAFNVNADFAAACVGRHMNADEIWFLTDQTGILDAQKNPIREASIESLNELIATEVVTGGMLTKVRACLMALQGGVESVHILNAKDALRLVKNQPLLGTHCQKSLDITIEEPLEDCASLLTLAFP